MTSETENSKQVLYALVVKEGVNGKDAFPVGCHPFGPADAVLAMYDELFTKNQSDDPEASPAEIRAFTDAFKKNVSFVKLCAEPNIKAVKVDPLTAVWDVIKPEEIPGKLKAAVEGFDPQKIVKAHGVDILKGVAGAFTKWGRLGLAFWAATALWGSRDQVQKSAKDFFKQAKLTGRQITDRMNGLDPNADGIVLDGVGFIKQEWLNKPGSVTPVTMTELRKASEDAAAHEQRKPRGPGEDGPPVA